MKKALWISGLGLAAAGVAGLWFLVRIELDAAACSRYQAAIRVAWADPLSSDPIEGLVENDLRITESNRDAFDRAFERAQTVEEISYQSVEISEKELQDMSELDRLVAALPKEIRTTVRVEEDDPRVAGEIISLRTAWDKAAERFEKEALARRGCA